MAAPHLQLRKLHATLPQPWRNGGGSTRELARGPAWRISVADVASDGPFSVFPDQQRLSVVIEGAGLDLQGPAGRLALDPMRCVSYDGDQAWDAVRRRGPVRVFNVMTTCGLAGARVLLAPMRACAPAGGIAVALCLGAGPVRLQADAGDQVLEPDDYLLLPPSAGEVRFAPVVPAAAVLLAVIAPSSAPLSS